MTEEIVGYGASPWEGKGIAQGKKGVNPYGFSAVLGEYKKDCQLIKLCFQNVQGQG